MKSPIFVSVDESEPIVSFQCRECELYAACRWGGDLAERTREDAEESCRRARCRCELQGDITDLEIFKPVRHRKGKASVGVVTAIDYPSGKIQLNGGSQWLEAGDYRPEWQE